MNYYDSIYHEHYFYYSINNLKTYCNYDLNIFDALENIINKGNMIIYFQKKNLSKNLSKLISEENKKILNTLGIISLNYQLIIKIKCVKQF